MNVTPDINYILFSKHIIAMIYISKMHTHSTDNNTSTTRLCL